MNRLRLTFIHPCTSAQYTADCDPELTGEKIINALIGEGFIEPIVGRYAGSYVLGLDGRYRIRDTETLAEAGARDGDTVHVILPCID